ncbi:tetratricopeptide repeat protein, partial [bacterium]|nr:tetratricopeptide repeat protein [bacterium]
YSNGMNYLKNQQYSSAINEFKKVLRFSPYDSTIQGALANSYYARAQYYHKTTKEIKRALVDYKSAYFYSKYWSKNTPSQSFLQLAQSAQREINDLEKRIEGGQNHLQNAKTLKAQGELAAAGYDFQQLLGGQNSNVAYENLSNIYKSLNNVMFAMEYIQLAINNNPKNAKLHFLYGVMLDEAKNYEASMEEYNLALQYGDKSPELMEILENKWTQNIVNNPQNAQNYVNLGAIYQKQGKFDGAKNQYLKAIQMNPNDDTAYLNLASLYIQQKNYSDAVNVYNQILMKKPNNTEILSYKANTLYDAKNYEEALKCAEAILRIKPTDKNALNMVDDIVYNRFEGDKLLNYLIVKANNTPQNYEAQFNCALQLHKNKKYPQAVQYYNRAIAANPAKEETYINLAQIFIEQKDFRNAQNVCQKGLMMLPESKSLNQYLTDAKNYQLNNIFDEATKLYEARQFDAAIAKYNQIPNKNTQVLMAIASCFWEKNDYKKANEIYNQVLAQEPNNKEALINSAYAYFSLNDFNSAKTTAQKILTLDKTNKEATEILQNITQSQNQALMNDMIAKFEKGDFKGSLEASNKLLSSDSNNEYGLYYKGLNLDELKNTNEAIKQYKLLISKHPNFENAYYSLAVDLDNSEKYKEAVNYYQKFVALKNNTKDDMTTFAQDRIKELNEYLGKVNGK